MEIDFSRLRDPFRKDEIKWVVTDAGIGKGSGKPYAQVAPYVSARAVQGRLDEVFTPAGWQCEFREIENGMICRISILVNGQWVYKEDGAAPSGPRNIDAVKTVISGAFKRCAVHLGIGRLYYSVPQEYLWAEASTESKSVSDGWVRYSKKDDGGKLSTIYWRPKVLPPHFYAAGPYSGPKSGRSSSSPSKAAPPTKLNLGPGNSTVPEESPVEEEQKVAGLATSLSTLKKYASQEMVTDDEKARAKAAIGVADIALATKDQVDSVYRELVKIVAARGVGQ